MKASDVMTTKVVTIGPDSSLSDMIKLMLDHRISGLPVVNAEGKLVGIVTEGDCLRRTETGTEVKRSFWRDLMTGSETLAAEYIRSHGRKVSEVMTPDPVVVAPDEDLNEVIHLMEKHQVKRVPVVRNGTVVGIVSRANLLQALAGLIGDAKVAQSDAKIREGVIAALATLPWAANEFLNVTVKDGNVDLWGCFTAYRQDEAAIVAAENVAGVKKVRSHLSWVDPMSGMVVYSPDDESAPLVRSSA
ncbi:CBS domain-containing protein [Hyphomicrobium sp.]|jgi:CBS domain-containing protein|uniref:CBS domain-containing protein n=1 Tax=Hyphomicrobium sp. TaxID=82 RepID=UPI000FBC30CE|nr:CBS domain-containing protein [Hyphomicrobium sp.]RUP00445.1 MAG: CBS domain-containing protein [Hyphomicrobium sp.]